ncbi:MAG TPA: hypothetical protein VF525_17995 [Pyrinomonadaceae bacterium]|jgi:hypothetical protein
MPQNETRRLKPAQLADDERVYTAAKGVKNYAPANPSYTQVALDAAFEELKRAQAADVQAAAAAAAARDNAVAKEWAFHNLMLGTKDQVVAMFGRDSNEAQALGLKKVSEYKKPTKKAKPDASAVK